MSVSRPRPVSLALVLVVIGSLVVACGGAGGSASVPPSNPSASSAAGESPDASVAPTKLVVGLGYIDSVQFAQFYLAQQQGYYAEGGLEVEFQNKIDPDLIPLVGSGTIDVGIGDGTSVIPAASNGIPVEYVATLYGKFPDVVFAKASSGIAKPADLKGKKIGIPGRYGSSWVMLQAMLASAGLTTDDVEIVEYPAFNQEAAVEQGAVDAATGYLQQRADRPRGARAEGGRPAHRRHHAAARTRGSSRHRPRSTPSTTRSPRSWRPRSRR